jgi:hypothetical protein
MKLAREDVSHLIEVLEAAVTKGINWDETYELAFLLTNLKTKVVSGTELLKVKILKKRIKKCQKKTRLSKTTPQ